MDRPSNFSLLKYHVCPKSNTMFPDTVFCANARLLQSKWREEKGYKWGMPEEGYSYFYDEYNCGDYIEKDIAYNCGCNFLTEKIKVVARKAIEDKKILDVYRFICHLRSSQPLCFNLFGEFLNGKEEILVEIFNKLKPKLMDTITKIIFEYSPGCLGDHTTFDVFIEYKKNDEKSFLGIEVKYAEDLSKDNEKEKEERYFIAHEQEYTKITENHRFFKPDVIDKIRKSQCSQIWRDHLLSISLKSAKKYDKGYFVFLYPSNNSECFKGIKDYMNFLEKPEDSIFELHLEELIGAIREKIKEDWTNELFHRYIEGL